MKAQSRHAPHVEHEPREPGGYTYCPEHWQGSVTRNAPGKTVLRGEDYDGLAAQELQRRADLIESQAVVLRAQALRHQ
jgi:hypothetical protein